METLEAIATRRSVREYDGREVSREQLDTLVEAARWAPSGLNNQPWRFMQVAERGLIEELSMMTKYRGVVAGAAALVCVFLDPEAMYDRTKDVLSAGAAVQNMLLAAHDIGLGACWLGEILARREEVERMLGVGEGMELMAVVALGYPVEKERAGVRHQVGQFLLQPPASR